MSSLVETAKIASTFQEEGSLQEGEKERIVAEHMGQLNEEHKKLGTSVPPVSLLSVKK